MASVFTSIMEGDLPAVFVWSDERCVAFMSIAPLRPGHTLVVPRAEVEHWLDLDEGTLNHVTSVAQSIGRALDEAFRPSKVGMMIAGLEVPHVHLHVVPIDTVRDLDFGNADPNADPADLESAAQRIRSSLRGLGYGTAVHGD